MSSFLPLIPLFVVCVSLHACIARPLRITKQDTQKYHFHKELDKETLLEICEICSSTKTLKEMITSGTELSTSLHTDSTSFLATKEKVRHARSMLGPTKLHVEKAFITNPSDTTEDFAQIDYAQPHRRLPIHN